MDNNTINKDNFRDLIDIYVSKWKWIAQDFDRGFFDVNSELYDFCSME